MASNSRAASRRKSPVKSGVIHAFLITRTRLLPGSGSGITEQFLASVTEISRNAVTVVREALVSHEKGSNADGLGSGLFPLGEEERGILAHGEQPAGFKVKMDIQVAEDGSSTSLVVSGFDTKSGFPVGLHCRWYRKFPQYCCRSRSESLHKILGVRLEDTSYQLSPEDIGCMVVVEVECIDASHKGKALLSEGPIEMDSATRRTIDNIIAAGGTRFQVQLLGEEGEEVDAILQVMDNGVRLTVTAPRNSYHTMESSYLSEYPKVEIHPKEHVSRFVVVVSERERWRLKALSRQARDLAVLTIRSLKGLRLYHNSRALIEGELGEGGGTLVMLLEMERLRTRVAGLVGEVERLGRQCRKAVEEKQTLADQLTDTIEAYTQVMESDGGDSGTSEVYRLAVPEDLDFTEEVETLRLSNRHLTVEVKTLRAEILKMKRDASRVQEAPQLSIDHKDGGVEEMQELQDARVRRLEYQKSSLETERDRLKEEVRQISEMYVKLWSEGTSSSDGLREEVVRLKEENESLRSRIRELIKRRGDVVSEPESLAEGI